MNTFKYILIVVILGGLVFLGFWLKKDDKVEPVPDVVGTVTTPPLELCFAKFGPANERGFSDRYTLRMLLDGEKVTGELNLLPAEKDSKVGKFQGTVSAVDKVMMARTANLWWDTLAEGMSIKEELKIIFGEGTASVGFGEMVDRGDGVYVYKDPMAVTYSLQLGDVSCTDLTLRTNIESYVKANIATLSPVQPVLGGSWYVINVTSDLSKNSGAIIYGDGHVQQKRTFTYTTDGKVTVTGVTIK